MTNVLLVVLRSPRRGRAAAAAVAVALFLLAGGAAAAPDNTALDAAFTTARQQALASLAAAASAAEQAKAAASNRVASLQAAAAAARGELAGLQKQLLAALTRDDAAAIRATRALLASREAAAAADDGEAALILKQAEEADRERDAWKKRAATLELALRIDMRVMLAGPAEIADRELRVEAAEKDAANQEAQIRKYVSRRDAAAVQRDILRRRLAVLTAAAPSPAEADLRETRDAEARQIRRQIAQQEEWFRLNRLLEERSRRNRDFARADRLVSGRYADALWRKGAVRRADDLLAQADRDDAQLALLRAALAHLQQAAATNLAAAAGQADAALQAIGDSRTAQEEQQAHAAYAGAQARKARWEAESDAWKEYVALEKAGAAFGRELADRARSLAEDRGLADINQEVRQLRDSLVTSEQYVRNFELLLQKTDAQIEAARRELALDAARLPELAAPVAELFASFDAARPPAPALVADLLQTLVERVPEGAETGARRLEQRRETAAALVARLAQRETIRTRKAISEHWIDNSRQAVQTLERRAGRQMWQLHDLRLTVMSSQETLALALDAAANAAFAGACLLHGIAAPGVPGPWRVLLGAELVLLAGLAGWLAGRALSDGSRLRRLLRKLAPPLLPLAVAAWLLTAEAGNPALLAAGWLLFGLAGWILARNFLLACTRDHVPPPGATIGGALFRAADAILCWSAMLLPLFHLATHAANPWDPLAVLTHLWIFVVCLALFRLAMHQTLAGRLLHRHSEQRHLRWLGGTAAWACVGVAALVAVTWLAGLRNLGQSVLHAAEGTFTILVVVVGGSALLGGWMHRRKAPSSGMIVVLVRAAQGALLAFGALGAAGIWWLLLTRAVLAPNAPSPLPDMVQAVRQALHALAYAWHAQLSAGVTVASLARGLLVFAASFLVARHAKRVMMHRVLVRTPMDEPTRQTFANVLGYVVVVLGFLVALNAAGSSLQNLALLAGAITVGVGFGLQNVINNFVSSLMIHFGRTIRVGDYIEVGATRGTVREIGMRNTMLVTDDEVTVLVPNGAFITANIVNWTNPFRRTRLHVPLTVGRQADLTAVAELARAAAVAHPSILHAPAPVLEVRSVTAAQVSLDLLVWTERPEKAVGIVGDISLALDRALRDKGFAV